MLEVVLSEKQDEALRNYIYSTIVNEVDRIRQDQKLNMLAYSRKNLATACGVSTSTIDKWQKMGLKVSYIGNTPYYTADALKAFMKEREQ